MWIVFAIRRDEQSKCDRAIKNPARLQNGQAPGTTRTEIAYGMTEDDVFCSTGFPLGFAKMRADPSPRNQHTKHFGLCGAARALAAFTKQQILLGRLARMESGDGPSSCDLAEMDKIDVNIVPAHAVTITREGRESLRYSPSRY